MNGRNFFSNINYITYDLSLLGLWAVCATHENKYILKETTLLQW